MLTDGCWYIQRVLTLRKLSQVVQKEKDDWCFCCEPLSRTSPGSNQTNNTAPPPPPPPPHPVTAHSRRIFSHYSGADRWASFCISAVHFLKSEKPIHLGQMHEEEEEGEEGEEECQSKTSELFFFPLFVFPPCMSVIHRCRAPPRLTFSNCVTLGAACFWCSR